MFKSLQGPISVSSIGQPTMDFLRGTLNWGLWELQKKVWGSAFRNPIV